MKILYIAMKYDYGDPKRGFSFEHYNFYDSLVEMNSRANQVIYFPFDEVMSKVGRDKMNDQLLETTRREKPDLCFFILFEEEIKKDTIAKVSEIAPTFNWFCDDHWRFEIFSKYYAPYFSWVATTDSQAVKKYHKIGYKNVIKTQWACNHFLYKPIDLATVYKVYDASFVGQPHGDRKKVIEKIKRAGIEVKCWGEGWPSGRISQDKMLEIFSQSKINLNLTKSSGVINWKTPLKIFLHKKGGKIKLAAPKRWLSNLRSILGQRREQIKGRNFEIPGCGGFLLTGYADNLEDYYEIGKEIVIYKDTNDLINKIKYYLEHDEERETIAQAGYRRTLRDHTYEKRFNEIFKIIGL